MIFARGDENREHIARHAVTPEEAEHVVEHAVPPFPEDTGNDKYRVWGRTADGRLLQVVYVLKEQSEVNYDSVDLLAWQTLTERPEVKIVRVIHAMELTGRMKKQLRRRRR